MSRFRLFGMRVQIRRARLRIPCEEFAFSVVNLLFWSVRIRACVCIKTPANTVSPIFQRSNAHPTRIPLSPTSPFSLKTPFWCRASIRERLNTGESPPFQHLWLEIVWFTTDVQLSLPWSACVIVNGGIRERGHRDDTFTTQMCKTNNSWPPPGHTSIQTAFCRITNQAKTQKFFVQHYKQIRVMDNILESNSQQINYLVWMETRVA